MWCASATKASATLTTTESTVWNGAGETTTGSAVTTTASPSSTYTTWPGVPPLPTLSWSVSSCSLVEHLRSAPLRLPALKPHPPKAKFSQVTLPFAPLTLVRLSLVCMLWCRSWGSLRHSGGLSPHLGLGVGLPLGGSVSRGFLRWFGLGTHTGFFGGSLGGSLRIPSWTGAGLGSGGVEEEEAGTLSLSLTNSPILP